MMRKSDYVMSGAIPDGNLEGLAILDVGGNNGWRFDLPEFAGAKRLVVVDPDKQALALGKQQRPGIEFHYGMAEMLHQFDAEFDLYMSIVSLPYSDIPAALREAYRVCKQGGRIHITMHSMGMQARWLLIALGVLRDKPGGKRRLALKRVLDHGYIATHGLWLAFTGKCFPRPWKSTYESFQTSGRMIQLAEAAGFRSVKIRATRRHFVIEAVKG